MPRRAVHQHAPLAAAQHDAVVGEDRDAGQVLPQQRRCRLARAGVPDEQIASPRLVDDAATVHDDARPLREVVHEQQLVQRVVEGADWPLGLIELPVKSDPTPRPVMAHGQPFVRHVAVKRREEIEEVMAVRACQVPGTSGVEDHLASCVLRQMIPGSLNLDVRFRIVDREPAGGLHVDPQRGVAGGDPDAGVCDSECVHLPLSGTRVGPDLGR